MKFEAELMTLSWKIAETLTGLGERMVIMTVRLSLYSLLNNSKEVAWNEDFYKIIVLKRTFIYYVIIYTKSSDQRSSISVLVFMD